jgi:hypothetical protein
MSVPFHHGAKVAAKETTGTDRHADTRWQREVHLWAMSRQKLMVIIMYRGSCVVSCADAQLLRIMTRQKDGLCRYITWLLSSLQANSSS